MFPQSKPDFQVFRACPSDPRGTEVFRACPSDPVTVLGMDKLMWVRFLEPVPLGFSVFRACPSSELIRKSLP
jgi:hypothetical protein